MTSCCAKSIICIDATGNVFTFTFDGVQCAQIVSAPAGLSVPASFVNNADGTVTITDNSGNTAIIPSAALAMDKDDVTAVVQNGILTILSPTGATIASGVPVGLTAAQAAGLVSLSAAQLTALQGLSATQLLALSTVSTAPVAITGTGEITVTNPSPNTFTIDAPAIVPVTLTGAGEITVTQTAPNTFTISAPAPTAVVPTTVGAVTNGTVTITDPSGSTATLVAAPIQVGAGAGITVTNPAPNTFIVANSQPLVSLTGAGEITVTSSGPNTFTVSAPAVTPVALTAGGEITIANTGLNAFTISAPAPTPVTLTAAGGAVVTNTGANAFTISAPVAIAEATIAQIQAGTTSGLYVSPLNLASAFGAYVSWPVKTSVTGDAVTGVTASTYGVIGIANGGVGGGILAQANGTATGNGLLAQVNSIGSNGNAVVGQIYGNATNGGNAVLGQVFSDSTASGGYFVVYGSGPGSGVQGVVTGNGVGSGVVGAILGQGPGPAINGFINGNGNGNVVQASLNGAGSGTGVYSQHNGTGNGDAGRFVVGAVAGATGTGVAVSGYAFNAPNNASHGIAVYGYQAVAANWAGYFNGKVFSSIGFTTSSLKLKSDVKDFTDEELNAVAALGIKSFVKHQNALTHYEAESQNIEALRYSIAARKAAAAARADQIATFNAVVDPSIELQQDIADLMNADFDANKSDAEYFAANQPLIDKHDALTAPIASGDIKGEAFEGRQAGIIYEDAVGVIPQFTSQDKDGIGQVSEIPILFAMIAALRRDLLQVKNDLAAYKAAHP
jgi:hypothetical protein